MRVASEEFPRTVRAHRWYVAAATALFLLPTVVVGLLVYFRPEMILSVVSSDTAAEFEQMYSPARVVDRTHPRSVDRLDDVRLLHPQQHRRRVPVFCRRPLRRARHRVLPRVQRRVLGRARRLSHRAGPLAHLLLLHRDALGVRAHRHRDCGHGRAAPRSHAARPWTHARGAWRWSTRRATRPCCCTA